MTEQDNDYVVSDVEYNVITTLATLLQSEDVLAQYTDDALAAGEDEVAQLFQTLRSHHREIARGFRAVLGDHLAQ